MVEYGNGGDLSVTMDGPFAGSGASVGGGAKVVSINAPAADWKGAESPYSMSVGVDGVSISSKVDVQLSPEQMAQFRDQIITFMVANDGGIATLYAFGDKPAIDCVLQATVTETTGGGVVLGAMVSTSVPRSDYGQTDETKADFIRNKPDAAIKKAQDTADAAKDTAEAALPKSGGTVTGALTVPDPTQPGHAANMGYVTGYVDSKRMEFQVTLTPEGWTGNGPYTQTVSLEGILGIDEPHIGLIPNDSVDIAETQDEAWNYVSRGVTEKDKITFTCNKDKPEIALNLHGEVNR